MAVVKVVKGIEVANESVVEDEVCFVGGSLVPAVIFVVGGSVVPNEMVGTELIVMADKGKVVVEENGIIVVVESKIIVTELVMDVGGIVVLERVEVVGDVFMVIVFVDVASVVVDVDKNVGGMVVLVVVTENMVTEGKVIIVLNDGEVIHFGDSVVLVMVAEVPVLSVMVVSGTILVGIVVFFVTDEIVGMELIVIVVGCIVVLLVSEEVIFMVLEGNIVENELVVIVVGGIVVLVRTDGLVAVVEVVGEVFVVRDAENAWKEEDASAVVSIG